MNWRFVTLLFVAAMLTACRHEPSTKDPIPEKGPAIATPAEQPAFVGIFSNEGEEFSNKTMILDGKGKGFYFAAVGGAPFLWKQDPKETNTFSITGPTSGDIRMRSFQVRFDPSRREFTILDAEVADGSEPLHLMTSEVPPKFQKLFDAFDGTGESIRIDELFEE